MELQKPDKPFKLDIYTPQRLEGESYEEYKIRRKAAKIAIKNYLKGRLEDKK